MKSPYKNLICSSNFFLLLLIPLLLISCTGYQKMSPPPDLDKGAPAPTVPCNPGEPIVDNSCWLATAANMLALRL